jgi:hypothetical protein
MLKIHKSYVIDENQQPVAIQVPINEFEQIESALQVIADDNVTPDIDIEKDIVVQMPPHSQKQVKLRVKHLGRAKLQVIYDPLPLD